jgi:hypothetical protein
VPAKLRGSKAATEPAPENEVLAARDRRCGIQLQKAEAVYDLEHVTGAVGVEQLRRDRQLPCPGPRQANWRHGSVRLKACRFLTGSGRCIRQG